LRSSFIIFGILAALAFGVIAAFDQSASTVDAGTGTGSATVSPTSTACLDDGDEGDGDPGDDPDTEDTSTPFEMSLQGDDDDGDGEDGEGEDSEDGDPISEWDDCHPDQPEPTLLGETETPVPTDTPTPAPTDSPSATPCPETPTPSPTASPTAGPSPSFIGVGFDPCTDDICVIIPILCCLNDAGGDPAAELICCPFGSGDPQVQLICPCPPFCAGTFAVAADADCDGALTPGDANETLQVIAGIAEERPCEGGDGPAGDVDCSGEIDVKDTLGILSALAQTSVPEEACSG
jgi:hypothetical protein